MHGFQYKIIVSWNQTFGAYTSQIHFNVYSMQILKKKKNAKSRIGFLDVK